MTDYAAVLSAVAGEIEALGLEFPQLASFRAAGNARPDALTISYAFRTHRPRRRPGWAGGVPNPDDDGIWFHLDFHDPGSQAQIHTQPCVPHLMLGNKIVWLLILEGPRTKSVAGRLREILRRHGAVDPR